jgi:hypothetical protein
VYPALIAVDSALINYLIQYLRTSKEVGFMAREAVKGCPEWAACINIER